jgi:signal transduction histidine kinase
MLFVFAANLYITQRVIHFVDNETREHMMFEKEKIIQQLQIENMNQDQGLMVGDLITIRPIPAKTLTNEIFKDTVFYDQKEFESVPFTQLRFQTNVKNKNYEIVIRKRLTEDEDVVNGLLFSFLWVSLCIVIVYFSFNKWFSATTLKPFYHALQQVGSFDVTKNPQLNFLPTKINEFKTLNEELQKLTNKAKDDYYNLKEFTENVSHEIRTPIALVQSRLETLLQSPNLSQTELEQIGSTLDAVQRLIEKNNSLLLLSRIENNQFNSIERVDAVAILNKILEDYKDYIDFKRLSLTAQIQPVVLEKSNVALIEILFSNLISNAIKYNVEHGILKIICGEDFLTVINSSKGEGKLQSEMFERYFHENHPEAIGLGLTIIQKICRLYNYEFNYTFNNNMHYFSIIFP